MNCDWQAVKRSSLRWIALVFATIAAGGAGPMLLLLQSILCYIWYTREGGGKTSGAYDELPSQLAVLTSFHCEKDLNGKPRNMLQIKYECEGRAYIKTFRCQWGRTFSRTDQRTMTQGLMESTIPIKMLPGFPRSGVPVFLLRNHRRSRLFLLLVVLLFPTVFIGVSCYLKSKSFDGAKWYLLACVTSYASFDEFNELRDMNFQEICEGRGPIADMRCDCEEGDD